jgi:hypothetical protein
VAVFVQPAAAACYKIPLPARPVAGFFVAGGAEALPATKHLKFSVVSYLATPSIR